MKRFALLTALAGIFLLIAVMPVLAGTNTITGTLTTSNPLLPVGSVEDDANACVAPLDTTGDFYYILKQFQVTTSGDYVYEDVGYNTSSGIDLWVTFYTGGPSGFNPADPRTDGCFANFDDGGTVNLTAGVTYMMLITSYDGNPATGSFIFSLTGPGNVIAPSGSNPMLSDGRINGQQAAPVILYCNGTTTHGLDTNGQVLFDVENGKSASGAWGSIAPTADGRMLLTSATPDGKPYYFVYDGCPHGHYDALSGDPAMVSDSGDY